MFTSVSVDIFFVPTHSELETKKNVNTTKNHSEIYYKTRTGYDGSIYVQSIC